MHATGLDTLAQGSHYALQQLQQQPRLLSLGSGERCLGAGDGYVAWFILFVWLDCRARDFVARK